MTNIYPTITANYIETAKIDNDNYQSVSDEVIGGLMQNSLIEYCNVLIKGKRALIGVVPYPLFSRSQREELERNIQKAAYSLYDFEEVVVSFDTDIIYGISKFNDGNISDEEFDKLFSSAKNRK